MRIIMVEHSHLLGGVERHVLDLMLALRANGHAVCYAGPSDGWLGEQCRRHDLATLALPMRGMLDVLSALRLARFARRWQADLLHGHTQRGTRYATWAGRWTGIAALATAHSTHAHRRFERAARTICVSDAVRASLLAHGLPAARLTRIHSGIADPAPLAPPRGDARRMLGLGDDTLVLGMIARFVRAKGHEVAIEALARLQRANAVLLLAGADDNDQAEAMRRLAAERGVAGQIRFLGERSDVPRILAACDLVLAPSHREALSLALLEAAAMGVPAVASRVGGIPEAVEDGVTGLLVPDRDPAAFAAAIARLADDPAARRQMGAAARQRFLLRFARERMCEAVESVYREVLDAHAPRRLGAGAPLATYSSSPISRR